MSTRSFFYTAIYSEFKKQNYLGALQNADRYSPRQKSAGFRRIYDYLIKVLEDIEKGKSDIQKYKRAVSRLIIQVQYQKARGFLDYDLAEGIKAALNDILRNLDKNFEESKASAEALRDALDAVLAFVITAKKGKGEEEEFL